MSQDFSRRDAHEYIRCVCEETGWSVGDTVELAESLRDKLAKQTGEEPIGWRPAAEWAVDHSARLLDPRPLGEVNLAVARGTFSYYQEQRLRSRIYTERRWRGGETDG